MGMWRHEAQRSRYRSRARAIVLALAVAAVSACGGDDGGAPVTDIAAAVEGATPGTVVVLTESSYSGSFSIPAGVTLDGKGATITGVNGAAVFSVTGGATDTPTRLINMRIENEGLAVVAREGAVELEDVTVSVSALGGVFAEGLDRLAMTRVTGLGSLNAENVSDLGTVNGFGLDARRYPIAGVLLADVADVELEELSLSGFGGFGAIFLRSQGSWNGGGVTEWVGTGVLVEDSDIELTGVAVHDSLSDSNLRLIPNGIAVTQGGSLSTSVLELSNIVCYGLLQDNARSAHTDLNVLGNARAGVWVQNSFAADGPALSISGASAIADNLGLGLYARDFEGLELDGVTISTTQTRSQLFGELGVVELGDGLQMTGASGLVRMNSTTLTGNSRVGWLIDGTDAETSAPFTFEGAVTINAQGAMTGEQEPLGLITQNDNGGVFIVVENGNVEVAPELAERDSLFSGTLAVNDALSAVAGFGDALGDQGLIGDDGLVGQDGRLVNEGVSVNDFGIVVENGM